MTGVFLIVISMFGLKEIPQHAGQVQEQVKCALTVELEDTGAGFMQT